MSGEDPLAELRKESERQADALAQLIAGLSDEQQKALQAMAEHSERVADWLFDYLGGHCEKRG
jgi:hypothetical protein